MTAPTQSDMLKYNTSSPYHISPTPATGHRCPQLHISQMRLQISFYLYVGQQLTDQPSGVDKLHARHFGETLNRLQTFFFKKALKSKFKKFLSLIFMWFSVVSYLCFQCWEYAFIFHRRKINHAASIPLDGMVFLCVCFFWEGCYVLS